MGDSHSASAARPLLTLAIPTYNRCAKVRRLLERFAQIHRDSPFGEEVELLISDNASTDGTGELAQEFSSTFPMLRYFRQNKNVGFDANVMSCYRQAQGDYVWLQSDDDIPDLGCVQKIVRALQSSQPDVLRFSFRQPADAQEGAFRFTDPLHLERDPSNCIELLMRFPKVTTYVLRRIEFDEATEGYHRSTLGDGFSFVVLGLSVLQRSQQPLAAVLSETLSCCDADYKTLDWPPHVILNSYRQAEHPWVRIHCPKLARTMKYKGYMHAIDLAYQVKQGQYQTSIPKVYANFGATVPYRLHYLIKRPKMIFRLWKLKRDAGQAPTEPIPW